MRHSKTHTLTRSYNAETIDIGKKLMAARVVIVENSQITFESDVVLTKVQLKAFLNNEGLNYDTRQFMVANRAMRDFMRCWPNPLYSRNKEDQKISEALINTSVFAALDMGASINDVIIRNPSDESYTDFQTGADVATGVMFDYISSNVNDGAYDLAKVAKILKKRSDIIPLGMDGRPLKAEGLAIQPIPYYNAEPHFSQAIQFIWTPSDEDYAKMCAKMRTYKGKYQSGKKHEAIFDLDLLGIREAAFFQDFHKSKRYE